MRDAYLYGDYQYGRNWGPRYDHHAKKVTWQEQLADTAVKVSSFRERELHERHQPFAEAFVMRRICPISTCIGFLIGVCGHSSTGVPWKLAR